MTVLLTIELGEFHRRLSLALYEVGERRVDDDTMFAQRNDYEKIRAIHEFKLSPGCPGGFCAAFLVDTPHRRQLHPIARRSLVTLTFSFPS